MKRTIIGILLTVPLLTGVVYAAFCIISAFGCVEFFKFVCFITAILSATVAFVLGLSLIFHD